MRNSPEKSWRRRRGGTADLPIDDADRRASLAENTETSENVAASVRVKETEKNAGRRRFFLR